MTDMVANELAIYNTTNVSFLATKNSGLHVCHHINRDFTDFSTLRINDSYLRTPNVLLENNIERSSLLKHTT